jgi:hypothetical protein
VDLIIGKTHLSQVLMDGGSILNLLYTKTYDGMGLSWAAIRPSRAPFHRVIPGLQAIPLGKVDLPVMFGGQTNFRTEMLTFDIADFPSTFHIILGWPCYAKFMAIYNYTYLKLKMSGPHRVITIGGDLQQAHLYEWENYNIMTIVSQPSRANPEHDFPAW